MRHVRHAFLGHKLKYAAVCLLDNRSSSPVYILDREQHRVRNVHPGEPKGQMRCSKFGRSACSVSKNGCQWHAMCVAHLASRIQTLHSHARTHGTPRHSYLSKADVGSINLPPKSTCAIFDSDACGNIAIGQHLKLARYPALPRRGAPAMCRIISFGK